MKKLSKDTNKVLHEAVEKNGTIFFTANLKTYGKNIKDERVRFDHSIVWDDNRKVVVTSSSGKDGYEESLAFVLEQFIKEDTRKPFPLGPTDF